MFKPVNFLNENIIIDSINVSEEGAFLNSDSRTISDTDFFLPLKGERFDGHDFIESLVSNGHLKFVVENSFFVENKNLFSPQCQLIVVENSLKYFQDCAELKIIEYKKNKDKKVISITGSNGKTTNKEILFSLCEYIFPGQVHCTKGNFNNLIGLPKTIQDLDVEKNICILEMGTNQFGEIEALCNIGHPDYGYITNIGQSHLEFLKDEEGVFKEKSALFREVIKNDGLFIINGFDKFLNGLDDSLAQTLSSSSNSKYRFERSDNNYFFYIQDEKFLINNNHIKGEHNYLNLSLALSLLIEIFPSKSVELLDAAKEIEVSQKNRGEIYRKEGRITFLDAYNANPNSMKASLKGFIDLLAEDNFTLDDSLIILGDMNELGDKSSTYHKELGEFASSLGFKNAVFIGRFAQHYSDGFKGNSTTVEKVEDASNIINDMQKTYTALFVKGSRSLQLESLKGIKY